MKLQAKGLMIGDWVQLNSKPMQVSRIDLLSVNVKPAFCCGSPHAWSYNNDFKPIPLTAEILEKNGWKYDETIKAYLWKDGNYYISIDLHGKTRVYVCNDYILGLPVDCVHELQHALRLCGIEKEIKL